MDFLYAVFDWVVFSSLVASLMVPIILLVKFAFKDKLPPSLHYIIWFLLLIRLVFPFSPSSSLSILNVVPSLKHMIQNIHVVSISPQTGYFNAAPPADDAVETRTRPQSGSTETMANNSVETTNSADHSDKTNPYLIGLIIWLTGASIFGIYVAFINGRLLLKIRANAQDVAENEPAKHVLDQCKTILKIRSDIPLIMTPTVQTPALFGFFRPILLIPSDLANQLNTNELKHVFFHELTHFKRKDFMVNGLMVLLKIIHWFNPYILLEQGAVNAALLDSGSLSTMYFDGNVVNNPSAGEQIVSSAFLVMP